MGIAKTDRLGMAASFVGAWGSGMRPPAAEELLLLAACLRVMPDFVRKMTRRVEPTLIAVLTAAGAAQVGRVVTGAPVGRNIERPCTVLRFVWIRIAGSW